MILSNEMFDVIKSDLELLEKKLLEAVDSSVAVVEEIGTHLVTAGGKRLRPALFLLAAHGGKDFSLEKAMPLAVSLELIHTASLVHDDVIDEAALRRGKPTANAKWGNQVSVLSGDYVFARAFQLVAAGDYGAEVCTRMAELVCNLSTGEIIQDSKEYQASLDMEDYYDRIKKKTADFLEVCSELGARIGGMPQEDVVRMAEFGHAIGMAFQITDDLLDIEQDTEKTGKPAGNDIRQGIVTLPVMKALKESPDCAELEAIVTNPDMTEDMVRRALEIVKESDGVAFAMRKADEYLEQARLALPASLPMEIRDAFLQVVDFIGERDF